MTLPSIARHARPERDPCAMFMRVAHQFHIAVLACRPRVVAEDADGGDQTPVVVHPLDRVADVPDVVDEDQNART